MIPVIIINGPLGSGKTTLIHEILKNHIDAKKTLWLKTEFGSESIDDRLLRDTGVQTKSLTGGCICHVLLSELDGVLGQVEQMSDIDQIIIETSGMSHPVPVVQTIERHSYFTVAQTVLVVDVAHAHEDTYPKPMILPVGVTPPYDRIIFNKYPPALSISEEGALEKTLDPWFAGVYNIIEKIHIPVIDNKNSESFEAFSVWGKSLHESIRVALLEPPKSIKVGQMNLHEDGASEDHEGDMEALSFHIPANSITARQTVENYSKNVSRWAIRIKGVFQTSEHVWEFFNWSRGDGVWSKLSSESEGQLLIVIGHDLKNVPKFNE